MDSAPEVRFHEWHKDGYVASTDPRRLDLDVLHGFLTTAYWSRGVSRETLQQALGGSLTIGLYDGGGAQAGFARIITDGAMFAYLRDVFVLAEHRGKGLGLWLAHLALGHPALGGVTRWMLATGDTHGLYAKLGFAPLRNPERYMVLQR